MLLTGQHQQDSLLPLLLFFPHQPRLFLSYELFHFALHPSLLSVVFSPSHASTSISTSNYHISKPSDLRKRRMPQAPSTRWCPTPEQLMMLEEMYRSGMRTPNASQIQQIAAHLSYYGKIEGKNVFYWFQNHKARDRQKLRRRLSRHHQLLHRNTSPHLQLHGVDEASPPPSPSSLLHHQVPFQFVQQDANQAMNLLGKLETEEKSEVVQETSSMPYTQEWMAMANTSISAATSQCCRQPLRTLDLFPTKSTGLRDECSTSKSSCFTATN